MLNFATSDPVQAAKKQAGGKQKGGRWTDRARDKRRVEGAVKKQSRPAVAAATVVENAGAVLGKRPREDDGVGKLPQPAAARPASAAAPSTAMIQPRRNAGASTSASTSAPPGPTDGVPIAKSIVGANGKKQYISSLFTAEGLPAPAPSAPIAPAQPSNAPLRAASPSTTDASPAPALAALGILPPIVAHLAGKMHLTGPTAVQATAVPFLLPSLSPSQAHAHDAILQAQTGSGKTLAFLLPLLQDLLTLPPSIAPEPTRAIGTLALILAPTRELAAQIYAVLEASLSLPSSSAFSFPPRALTPCLLVGGANRTHEKSRLRKGCPIVVATPGRLLDHLRTTESFRMAGEPIASKGPRGRGAGIPGTGSNYGALGRDRSGAGRALGLRWLVVDECDRLMDLGFEEQMKGVLEELERRSPSASLTTDEGRRRTILCSATASEGVDLLAGMALHNPVTLRASTAGGVSIPPTLSASGEVVPSGVEEKISFTPPTQLVHNYVVCPPKLRFVGLVALLRRILNAPSAKKGPGTKILIFLSCTAAVDFYWEALGAMGMGAAAAPAPKTNVLEGAKERVEREKAAEEALRTKLASESPLLPGVPIYRLHGNLELATRLGSLAAFSKSSEAHAGRDKGNQTENAILLCTSVAARGLDVPFVSHVVQYDLPTEVRSFSLFFLDPANVLRREESPSTSIESDERLVLEHRDRRRRSFSRTRRSGFLGSRRVCAMEPRSEASRTSSCVRSESRIFSRTALAEKGGSTRRVRQTCRWDLSAGLLRTTRFVPPSPLCRRRSLMVRRAELDPRSQRFRLPHPRLRHPPRRREDHLQHQVPSPRPPRQSLRNARSSRVRPSSHEEGQVCRSDNRASCARSTADGARSGGSCDRQLAREELGGAGRVRDGSEAQRGARDEEAAGQLDEGAVGGWRGGVSDCECADARQLGEGAGSWRGEEEEVDGIASFSSVPLVLPFCSPSFVVLRYDESGTGPQSLLENVAATSRAVRRTFFIFLSLSTFFIFLSLSLPRRSRVHKKRATRFADRYNQILRAQLSDTNQISKRRERERHRLTYYRPSSPPRQHSHHQTSNCTSILFRTRAARCLQGARYQGLLH